MWELDYKQSWALENWCFWTVVLEKTLKSTLDSKEIQPAHPKGIDPEYSLQDWCWNWHSNTLATWCEELTYLKRPWCWERLKVGGEGDDRGWDGWMASLTQWRWWQTVRPGVLQSMGSQRVGHDWATELNWAVKVRYETYGSRRHSSFRGLKNNKIPSYTFSFKCSLLIYLFLTALGLHGCEPGLLPAVHGLLIVAASLVVEHGF